MYVHSFKVIFSLRILQILNQGVHCNYLNIESLMADPVSGFAVTLIIRKITAWGMT